MPKIIDIVPNDFAVTTVEAANIIGSMSAKLYKKLQQAEIVSDDITIDEVADLATRPWVRLDEALPVLRIGPAVEVEPDPDDDRRFYGFATSLTDDQVLNGVLRYWVSNSENVVGKPMVVTIATFVVACVQITGVDRERTELVERRTAYTGDLLARLSGPLQGGEEEYDTGDFGSDLIGKRLWAQGGGPLCFSDGTRQ